MHDLQIKKCRACKVAYFEYLGLILDTNLYNNNSLQKCMRLIA